MELIIKTRLPDAVTFLYALFPSLYKSKEHFVNKQHQIVIDAENF